MAHSIHNTTASHTPPGARYVTRGVKHAPHMAAVVANDTLPLHRDGIIGDDATPVAVCNVVGDDGLCHEDVHARYTAPVKINIVVQDERI